jgi:protein O-GlcNAc transferase
VRLLSDAGIAARAREIGIDIAIDLTGYTENARTGIFALRAAPVQISFLGYMGTMGSVGGAGLMDYLISDAVAVPDAQRAHICESLIRLPGSFMPPDSTRAAADVTRAEIGLPENGFVFASFNNAYKFAADSFGIWARLLQQVPGSVLWLRQANPYADANLKRALAQRGVDPARLIFAGRVAMDVHLGRHRLADLFLDSFHYNAHSSALDALTMGLPVLTLAGHGLAARVAASLVMAAGLPELVTHSAADYERLALALATDPARLAVIRARLAGQTAPLFDSAGHARHMEAAYEGAFRRHLAGQAPQDFTVQTAKS